MEQRVDPVGELLAASDSAAGVRRYELDPIGRVTGIAGDHAESYAYDRAGNVTNAVWGGDGAVQGERGFVGTLVASAGRDRFVYDDAGRLVERHRALLSGGCKSWAFSWDGSDQLVEVRVPDGSRWVYVYDPLGRRVSKTHLDVSGQLVERVGFVWDGPRLVEQSVVAGAGVATTCWEYQGWAPVAQLVSRTVDRDTETSDGVEGWSAERVDAEFAAIVTDLVGAPTRLIDATGATTWVSRPSLWGAGDGDVGMPLRFPGQYADSETGLFYNLHRYYNPATGSYVSLDPLGLTPSPNPTSYPANPTVEIDPLGLAPNECATEVNGGLGNLEDVNANDPSTSALADRIGGRPSVRFANGPANEFDAVSDAYVAQAKPANFTLNKAFRDQAKVTFETAVRSGRVPYFQFNGRPGAGVLESLARYASRYGIEPVVDLTPLG